MIEELKELLKLIQHMPDYVMWVLAGILFYKVFIVGNIYALIRFAIHKLHDYMTKEKVVRTEITYRGICISQEVELQLHSFLKNHLIRRDKNLNYIFEGDLNDLEKAWIEFKKKEQK